MRETHAMDRWAALGIFLLGAAAGALITTLRYTGQICRLKDLAARNNPQTEQDLKSEERKSA
jgi:hypothetical protein